MADSHRCGPLMDGPFSGCPDSAVIALMYEAWEARSEDVSAAVHTFQIRLVGVNEHSPACGSV